MVTTSTPSPFALSGGNAEPGPADASQLSYRIRTPLAGILGLAEILLDGDLPADEVREHLRTIRDCGREIQTVLPDLVRTAHRRSGQPLASAEPATAASSCVRSSASRINWSGRRFLVVDDIRVNRQVVRFALQKANPMLVEAENGQEAIATLTAARDEGQPFDLVLLDMQMPVMDGYAAARQIRSQGDTVPIIGLTAKAIDGDIQRCLDAGCDGYLAKPYTPHTLVEQIHSLLTAAGRSGSRSESR